MTPLLNWCLLGPRKEQSKHLADITQRSLYFSYNTCVSCTEYVGQRYTLETLKLQAKALPKLFCFFLLKLTLKSYSLIYYKNLITVFKNSSLEYDLLSACGTIYKQRKG